MYFIQLYLLLFISSSFFFFSFFVLFLFCTHFCSHNLFVLLLLLRATDVCTSAAVYTIGSEKRRAADGLMLLSSHKRIMTF